MLGTFAPITEEFDLQFARTIPPSAQHLWTWLRRQGRPETPIEFRLADFIQTFGYSIKWARQALATLVDVGLVAIDVQARSFWFRVRVFQVGQIGKKTSPNENRTSDLENKTSPKGALNPHEFVHNKEKEIDQQNQIPTPHPVSFSQEKILEPQDTAQHSSHEELFREIELAGIPLNPSLKQIVINATLQTVYNALAAFKEQRQKGNIQKNPAGFFRRAIENGFKPNSESPQRRSREATPITPAQQRPVQQDYARLGVNPQPTPRPAIASPLPPNDDLSDILAHIQLYHRQLGLQRKDLEAQFQERYGKSRISMLSESDLLDWYHHLQSSTKG